MKMKKGKPKKRKNIHEKHEIASKHNVEYLFKMHDMP